MGRRRKTEVKTSEKTSHKNVPVRKSSRQIAKKQLEERKLNGDITQTSSNSSDDFKSVSESCSQVTSKKSQNHHKKHSKHKVISNDSIIVNNYISQYKQDTGESDSQDNIDSIINEKELKPEDIQAIVGTPKLNNESLSASTSISNEVEMWSEDVVEETIICEEMEVEENVINNSYSLTQNNVMVDQVLLVNKPDIENKKFTDFIIQTKDGAKSVISNSRNILNNDYYVTSKTVNNIYTDELEKSISNLHKDESVSQSENCNTDFNTDKPYINKKKIVLGERSGKKQTKSNKPICDKMRRDSESVSNEIHMYSVKDNHGFSAEKEISKQENKHLERNNMCADSSKEDTYCKIGSKLADMQINECSKEIQKLVNDLSSVDSSDSLIQISFPTEKMPPVDMDDESSSSILDKMEQLHHLNSVSPSEILSGSNNVIRSQDQDILKSNSCNDKIQCADRVSLKSKISQDIINISQEKNTEHLPVIDEYQDSEGDNNKDADDKLCSSSENSNDTLLSISNGKRQEPDIKTASSIDKKVEFRGRSGSTDTTGSESGSNSSGVRRSSRIRSKIGLMKQRYMKLKNFILN